MLLVAAAAADIPAAMPPRQAGTPTRRRRRAEQGLRGTAKDKDTLYAESRSLLANIREIKNQWSDWYDCGGYIATCTTKDKGDATVEGGGSSTEGDSTAERSEEIIPLGDSNTEETVNDNGRKLSGVGVGGTTNDIYGKRD